MLRILGTCFVLVVYLQWIYATQDVCLDKGKTLSVVQNAIGVLKGLNENPPVLEDQEKDRPAFTVTLKKRYSLSQNYRIIKFDTVILNQGGGYDLTTGIFTAPKSGLYQISVTIMANAHNSLNLAMVKNNIAFLNLYAPALHGASETANPVLDLKQGDKVNVGISRNSAAQNVNGDHYTYFSGYLIS